MALGMAIGRLGTIADRTHQATPSDMTVQSGRQHDQIGVGGLAASESQPEQQVSHSRRLANMPAKLCCAFGHVADGEGCCVIHKAHLQV